MMDFEGYTAYQFSNVFESINKHFLMWKLKSSSYIKLILDYTYISPEYWWTTFIWTAFTNGVQFCWTMNERPFEKWMEELNGVQKFWWTTNWTAIHIIVQFHTYFTILFWYFWTLHHKTWKISFKFFRNYSNYRVYMVRFVKSYFYTFWDH